MRNKKGESYKTNNVIKKEKLLLKMKSLVIVKYHTRSLVQIENQDLRLKIFKQRNDENSTFVQRWNRFFPENSFEYGRYCAYPAWLWPIGLIHHSRAVVNIKKTRAGLIAADRDLRYYNLGKTEILQADTEMLMQICDEYSPNAHGEYKNCE